MATSDELLNPYHYETPYWRAGRGWVWPDIDAALQANGTSIDDALAEVEMEETIAEGKRRTRSAPEPFRHPVLDRRR